MLRPSRALVFLLIVFTCLNTKGEQPAPEEAQSALGKVLVAIPVLRNDLIKLASGDPKKVKEAKDKLDDDLLAAGGYVIASVGVIALQRLLAPNIGRMREFQDMATRSAPVPRGPRLVIVSFSGRPLDQMGRLSALLRAGYNSLVGRDVTLFEVKNRDEFLQVLQREAARGKQYADIEINMHGSPGVIWFRDGSSLNLSDLKGLPAGSVAITQAGGTWRFNACNISAGCRDGNGDVKEVGAEAMRDLLLATAPNGGTALASSKILAQNPAYALPLPTWLTATALHLTGIWLPLRAGELFTMLRASLWLNRVAPQYATGARLVNATYNPGSKTCPWNFIGTR